MLQTIVPRDFSKYERLSLLGPISEPFALWLTQQGYTRRYMRVTLNSVRKMIGYLRRTGIQSLDGIDATMLHKYWKRLRQRSKWEAGAIRLFERFLNIKGILASHQVSTPRSRLLDEYLKHLRDVRGLAPATLTKYLRTADLFLAYVTFERSPQRLAKLNARDVEGFLQLTTLLLNRKGLRDHAISLRSFLRFLASGGKASPLLIHQVATPRIYKMEKLPRALPWTTVQRFLRSIPKDTQKGRRDHAMFFLMAAYGLRVSEVAALTLDDFDWRHAQFQIWQKKTKQPLNLPLTDEVMAVLLDYLRHSARPKSCRNLFLKMRAPINAMGRTAIAIAFRYRFQQSSLSAASGAGGPHTLRHSYALHLLRQGISLKTIGDLLGHKCVTSTAGYLRLATADLRKVALPLPSWTGEEGRREN